ncbi:hypothetical protein GV794_25045 [Nocardia cyriacigeorgica]|uniref:Uncharacterized protein n=1 Tax=Nocardia cyriacigeorgica TaxID=135487 RepID=A0A6P1DAK0_9NOCA|nr:hypothetical protein [Nocardia cyriacigeorgica]NEW47148.1 hypothetical protein [Nocardia cyriacigeorgica]NEW58880.1 hypothetical protein [Nocardia cyriacigeorgica]
MKPVRSRTAVRRRYPSTRPPRGVRAEVMVRSSLGHWVLENRMAPTVPTTAPADDDRDADKPADPEQT